MASETTESGVPAGAPPTNENFAQLLDESLSEQQRFEGQVITGKVVAIDNDYVLIDVGLKSEGRVPLKEFATPASQPNLAPGDPVDVYVERYEDRDGIVML